MKTRTLLLLSIACGLAIMLAGAAFLVQLATQDEVAAPLGLGDRARVGDMQVEVVSASEVDGLLEVVVVIGGTADDDPADDFRLIASGRAVRVVDSTCPPTSTTPTIEERCAVSFDVAGADGTSRVLFYQRGDDQARWVLS
jgi:hypothetical protein